MLSPIQRRHAQPAPAGASEDQEFLSAVLQGLAQSEKSIPCRFLYDQAGSQLFDEICDLEEYYPTRTEKSILRVHAPEVGRLLESGLGMIELGAGSGGKAELVLDAMRNPVSYLCIDISPQPLAATAREMARRYPGLRVSAICANYLDDFDLAVAHAERHLCFFPGSTIGNFERPQASAFLAHWRRRLGAGSSMLIGVDLKKNEDVLLRAYDDSRGVTARFSLNLLRRANRELGADFDLTRFRHRARYVAEPGHVEITLESLAAQTVTIAGRKFRFGDGEALHVENSHKYGLAEFSALARSAGWRPVEAWVDADAKFSVHLLTAGLEERFTVQ